MFRGNRVVGLLSTLALLLACLGSAGAEAQPARKVKPLTEADVLRLVELQKEEAAILARLEAAGVDFKVDAALLDRLKRAGASDAVLAALGKEKAPPGKPAGPVNVVRPMVIKGHTNTVHAVAFAPDGRLIATGSEDKTIRIWGAATGQRQERISHTDPVYCLAFSPDGKTLASGGTDKAVTLWDVASGEKKKTLANVSNQPVAWVRFAPDGQTLATFGVGKDVAAVWGLSSGKEVAALKGHTRPVNGLEFSPDGKAIATVSGDSTVRLWDAATGKEKDNFRAHDGSVNCVAFSRDGKSLVTGGADKTVIVWDLRTGNLVKPVLEGHSKPVWFVRHLPDGRLLSRASGGGLFLWKHPTNKPTVLRKDFAGAIFSAGYYYPNEIALSPDAKTLAVGHEQDVQVQPFATDLGAGK
ncbi:MAG TPA: WD40 repeat domain-containing protein [Gemmataceae bacterium]|jgi:WD40 repeat protein|nr:WD40 repeat domain-containing protein [Gemmataceae bacterium]